MNYKVNWNIAEGVFAVPDCVTDNYIKLASGKAVKVLLYIMRHKNAATENAENIAESLDKHMTAEDVEDALSYWEQVGVICSSDTPPKQSETIPDAALKTVKTDSGNSDAKISIKKANARLAKTISPDEIAERISSSDEIAFLFKGAEDILGRPLNYTESSTLINAHDFYSIGSDILLMVMDYCKSIDKMSMSYFSRILSDFSDKNITTHEETEAEIRRLQLCSSLRGQVVYKLGLNRALTKSERNYVDSWSDKGVTIELIEYAYEKTITATGKVTFSYMNTILSDWAKNNLRTISEIDSYNAKFAQRKSSASSKKAAPKVTQTNREHSYDLNKLLEHAINNVPTIKED
ncbi:MAG: DnaD domain protein [Oscillospiraceae bacterium]|nr:DnaD domain protein [Oscillospiraceae bacterium]